MRGTYSTARFSNDLRKTQLSKVAGPSYEMDCNQIGEVTRQRLLVTRIDRSELRLNHFANKLAKISRGLPAKYFANLICATYQLDWLCRPFKRRVVLHIFLPW